jgi:hypothetical protein
MPEKETVTIRSPGREPVTVSYDTFSKLAAAVGNDNQLIFQAAESLAGLLHAHWPKIRELADQLDEDGEHTLKSQVAVKLVFDFSGKTPAGAVNISYALKTTDGATFRVDDAQQGKLGLGGAPDSD